MFYKKILNLNLYFNKHLITKGILTLLIIKMIQNNSVNNLLIIYN